MLTPALEQASEQARRAGQIIRSVHEFVKKREPQRQLVDIGSVVDGIGALIELQASKYFVAIQTSIPPSLPAVSADRMMLEQVLLNLTRNAIEAMQDMAPERRVLRIAAAHEAGQVTVSVIDQGHGIAPEVAERLFSPFFSTKAEGMGMGLSICRTAIEFHGGTLSHSANPDGGTMFTFALPSQAELSWIEFVQRTTKNTETFMLHIVDDEEVIRDSLAWLAQSRGIAACGYASAQGLPRPGRRQLRRRRRLRAARRAHARPERRRGVRPAERRAA